MALRPFGAAGPAGFRGASPSPPLAWGRAVPGVGWGLPGALVVTWMGAWHLCLPPYKPPPGACVGVACACGRRFAPPTPPLPIPGAVRPTLPSALHFAVPTALHFAVPTALHFCACGASARRPSGRRPRGYLRERWRGDGPSPAPSSSVLVCIAASGTAATSSAMLLFSWRSRLRRALRRISRSFCNSLSRLCVAFCCGVAVHCCPPADHVRHAMRDCHLCTAAFSAQRPHRT